MDLYCRRVNQPAYRALHRPKRIVAAATRARGHEKTAAWRHCHRAWPSEQPRPSHPAEPDDSRLPAEDPAPTDSSSSSFTCLHERPPATRRAPEMVPNIFDCQERCACPARAGIVVGIRAPPLIDRGSQCVREPAQDDRSSLVIVLEHATCHLERSSSLLRVPATLASIP